MGIRKPMPAVNRQLVTGLTECYKLRPLTVEVEQGVHQIVHQLPNVEQAIEAPKNHTRVSVGLSVRA
jgi:hypothetical protein